MRLECGRDDVRAGAVARRGFGGDPYPGEGTDTCSARRLECVQVVAPFEERQPPAGGHQPDEVGGEVGEVAADESPSPVSGSALWASKPAEMISQVGSKVSASGAMRSSNADR